MPSNSSPAEVTGDDLASGEDQKLELATDGAAAADRGFETEILGNDAADKLTTSVEFHLVKDGDQRQEVSAGSVVDEGFQDPDGAVDVNHAVLQGFQAGSLLGVRNPDGSLVESENVSTKTEVSVAFAALKIESLESVLYQEQVEVEATKIHDKDSHQPQKKLLSMGDLVSLGSEAIKTVPAIEAEGIDRQLVDDGSMDTGDFIKRGIDSAKFVLDTVAENADQHLLNDNVNKGDIFIASADSVLSQSRVTNLIDENPCNKGDEFLVSSCQLHESLMEKVDIAMHNPVPTLETSVVETLEMSESRTVLQGNKSVVFSANEGRDVNTNEVEPSPGRDRRNMESHVPGNIFPSPVDGYQEVETFERSEAGLMTPPIGDSAADFVAEASSVLIGEQILFRSAEEETLQLAVTTRNSSLENSQAVHYCLPPQVTTELSVSDLVWGKVKSHPWWPGQIIDPSNASKMALKHQKKDNFLVAYFGDKTFAWCDESQLKPFYACFSQMENQCSSDVFVNSVEDSLREVSRRVELGMTCFCLPEESYANIKYQKIVNAGIRKGRDTSFFDRHLLFNYFQSGILLDYVKALAQFPTAGAERLDLVIAQSQLKAFYHSKGYPELPKFSYAGWLMENDAEVLPSMDRESMKQTMEHSTPMCSGIISGKVRKRGRPRKNHKAIMEGATEQKNDAMEEKNVVSNLCSSGYRREVVYSASAGSGKSKKKRLDILGKAETNSPSSTLNTSFKVEECINGSGISKKSSQDPVGDLGTKSPYLSFKIGECIRRAASQLTGLPPILKSPGESFHKSASKHDHKRAEVGGVDDFCYDPVHTYRTKTAISVDYSSPGRMLSQLCLAARAPLKGSNSLSTAISFFTDFRNSCISDSSDISTPDHMKDSYWCDVMFRNCSGKVLLSNGVKRKGETGIRGRKKKMKSAGKPASSLSLSPLMETALQLPDGAATPSMKPALIVERSIIAVEEKIVDTPTALVLSFNSLDSLPSQTSLIRIFSRYGPLREAETEVVRKTNRVKVVFKRRADAELAFSSAGKFSIFGPSLVSYQLKYSPLTPKISPCASPQGKDDAVLTEVGDIEISAQPETGLVSETAQVKAVDTTEVEAVGIE